MGEAVLPLLSQRHKLDEAEKSIATLSLSFLSLNYASVAKLEQIRGRCS